MKGVRAGGQRSLLGKLVTRRRLAFRAPEARVCWLRIREHMVCTGRWEIGSVGPPGHEELYQHK